MSTTIATKSDLQLLRHELVSLITGQVQELRKDNALLRKDVELLATSFRKDLELQSTAITVRLGSLVAIGLGVLFAALKLTA